METRTYSFFHVLKNILIIAICLFIPIMVGLISSKTTPNSQSVMSSLNKPFLTPPGWLFPVVWSILYVLMGISLALVMINAHASFKGKILFACLFIFQLALNFAWSIIFFGHLAYISALICLIVLWFAILACIISAQPISRLASALLIPYLIWVTFAGYLNIGFAMLN